jgi:DNA-binding protein HU-beta
MNKAELISAMAQKSGLKKGESEHALNALMEVIQATLVANEKVVLVGFGTFETKTRAARKGLNPRTREEIEIPATTAPVFKAGKDFKQRVQGNQ